MFVEFNVLIVKRFLIKFFFLFIFEMLIDKIIVVKVINFFGIVVIVKEILVINELV